MKIFLSHSSRQKPLVREIRKGLPNHISTWIDEEKLLIGDDLSGSLESAVKSEADYVLLFLDESAAKSAWVAREVEWAIETERRLGRTFLLPIVIDRAALDHHPVDLGSKKYLVLKDFTEAALRDLADAIASELFALICRDLQRSQNPKPVTASKALSDADAILSTTASLIRKAVFPHRKENPISLAALRDVVNSQAKDKLSASEFESLLTAVVQRNLVPGLAYDGFELHLVEEHARWKSELNHDNKAKVGRRAASLIQNGMSIFLDAGSTTEEIARVICRKIEARSLTKIAVATTSINLADLLSDCCVAMGFDDEFSAVRLFVPGGQVRPGTQAIIPLPNDEWPLTRIAKHLGGFDIGIVGTNGVHIEHGFTTHENAEALNKLGILAESRLKVIVCDSSKLGIRLERKFADFQDDVRLVVNSDPDNSHLQDVAARFPEKVILA